MKILGLTGSIATGKSFVAACFLKEGIPVFDADKTVHALLAEGGKAVNAVAALFPGVKEGGTINRATLRETVFADKKKLARLEAILHPLVRQEQTNFLRTCKAQGHRLAVLDIPLLFEKGMDHICDAVLVTTVDDITQKKRVEARHILSDAQFQTVKSLQMTEEEKKHRADYVLDTARLDEKAVHKKVKEIIILEGTPA